MAASRIRANPDHDRLLWFALQRREAAGGTVKDSCVGGRTGLMLVGGGRHDCNLVHSDSIRCRGHLQQSSSRRPAFGGVCSQLLPLRGSLRVSTRAGHTAGLERLSGCGAVPGLRGRNGAPFARHHDSAGVHR